MSASPTEAPPVGSVPLQSGPRRPSGGLTFRSPAPAEDDLPTTIQTADGPEWTGEGTSPADPLAGSPSDSDEWSDASDLDDSGQTSSSTSSAGERRTVKALGQKAQQAAARTAVKMAGTMAHTYLAQRPEQRAVGLYLADDDDAAAIGDPLARIAARHGGDAGAIANPDVADGIAAMMGVATFVTKQVQKGQEAAALAAGYQGPQLAPDVA